jgi:hypothetical protein
VPQRLRLCEPRSGLDLHLTLLPSRAPESCAFLTQMFARPRQVEALHAMYTGPEISLPLDSAEAMAAWGDRPLRLENATAFPAAGDLVLTYLPAGLWAGSALPVFDLGLFYASGGRTLLPIGLVAGSVCATAAPEDLPAAAAACARLRRLGAAAVEVALV